MHDLSVLITLAGALAVALVLGFLAHRLKLSPIVGYLLAGVVVGPFTPGFSRAVRRLRNSSPRSASFCCSSASACAFT